MNLSQMRASVRRKADEKGTGFISDAEIDQCIDQAHLYVYGKVVQAFEGYFVVPGTLSNGGKFTTAVDTLEYSAPSGMKKLVRVEGKSSTSTTDNDYRKLRKVNIGDATLPQTDSSLYTIRLWFVPERTKLVDDTDEPTLPEAYHYTVCDHAAAQVLGQSGEVIFKEQLELLNMEMAAMLESVENRDQECETMTNVDNHRPELDFLYTSTGSGCAYLLAGNKLYIGYDPRFYLRAF